MIFDADEPAAGPLADLDGYLAMPQVAGLWLAPDGRALVVGAATPDHTGTRHAKALWEIDPDGVRQARRLTRGAEGETGAGFTPTGDLLFTSTRPEPGADDGQALWVLPRSGGEPWVVARPPGGVRGVAVGADGTVVFGSGMLPSATDLGADQALRARREDAGVSAILHDEFPIRHWDRHLGPDRPRLFVLDPGGPRDLTGHVGRALGEDSAWDVTPDGSTVVTTWAVTEPCGSQRYTLVAVDSATGARRVVADDPGHEYDAPRVSPDGTRVAVVVHRRKDPHDPGDRWLGVVDLAGGAVTPLTADWDRWPHAPQWTPDGTALVCAADHFGRSPLWRVDATTGEVTRLTDDDGAYTDPRVSPDGRWVYALRSAIDSPPAPVRVDLADGTTTPLPGPAEALGATAAVRGTLTEVTATAADGTPLRAWLTLPPDASPDSPAPLLLWVHGGPVLSRNNWSWRWNPWIPVARGYAVLMPDPALSTGYGIDFIRRGWGAWGTSPYTDLMAITDAALARPDLDPARTAAMGGSFGGYMVNWIAGHTDRFRAIVSHASVWDLDQSTDTADIAHDFRREMTPAMAEANSPHHFAAAVRTPVLVIHGDRDYRVPINEALRLWWDLCSHAGESHPHRFLYFPDENHFVQAPGNVKLWYATVLAFLAQHVLGEEWHRPDLLG
ncbi:prolyl oligopeptidase family serine peptidase [Actinokineospora auranticolor]|uniref:Dipeptidyl aminopeptidase/acylaminoacyl peptidase n=1 Tax=Actinokineospora auranticolor TaxID=155976 RepID=A0A2S6GNZ1_9PSEU|nr:prolyl oligopeptidase family serine peptidase [Actinokineospora auranticolor]PPK66883.1 dipeptidyl aminopeptidase/acylaminoacyl peptidase [Actinokineospora auranticolor]